MCASPVSQEQRAWLIEQVEGLKPLPRSLARRALQALVSADAFERFLATSFPASKVRQAVPGSHTDQSPCGGGMWIRVHSTLRLTEMGWSAKTAR